MEEVFEKMNIVDDPSHQHRMFQATFQGTTKDVYTQMYNKHQVRNDERSRGRQLSELKTLELVVNDTDKKFFPNWQSATCQQKNYLCTGLYIGDGEPAKFFDRLIQMNSYFPYFPHRDDQEPYQPLAEDE